MIAESREPQDHASQDTLVASAAIVIQDKDRTFVYPMFEVRDLRPEGALLQASLFLEVGEVVVIELSLGNGQAVRACARVVALERGDHPGMRVEFVELAESDRELMAAWAKRVSQS